MDFQTKELYTIPATSTYTDVVVSTGWISHVIFDFGENVIGDVSIKIKPRLKTEWITLATDAMTTEATAVYHGHIPVLEGDTIQLGSECATAVNIYVTSTYEQGPVAATWEMFATGAGEASTSSSSTSSSSQSSDSSSSNSSDSSSSQSSDSTSSSSSSSVAYSSSSSSQSNSSDSSSSTSSESVDNVSSESSSSSKYGCETYYCGSQFLNDEFNVTWTYVDTYADHPYYTSANGNWYLFWDATYSKYVIAADLGDASDQWESSQDEAGSACPDGNYDGKDTGFMTDGACETTTTTTTQEPS